MLNPYNIKIKIFCKDDAEARKMQEAAVAAGSDFKLVAEELLRFYSKYKQNESVLRPIIFDVSQKGVSAIGKHVFSLSKLK